MRFIKFLSERIEIGANLLVFAHQIKKFSMHLEQDVLKNNTTGIKTSVKIIEDNLKSLKRNL
jgi:hypothetical protein